MSTAGVTAWGLMVYSSSALLLFTTSIVIEEIECPFVWGRIRRGALLQSASVSIASASFQFFFFFLVFFFCPFPLSRRVWRLGICGARGRALASTFASCKSLVRRGPRHNTSHTRSGRTHSAAACVAARKSVIVASHKRQGVRHRPQRVERRPAIVTRSIPRF